MGHVGTVSANRWTATEWLARREAHQAKVDAWLAPHLERRRRRASHPVEDFLFTYYSHRPGHLRRWHPGQDVLLEGGTAAEFGGDHVDVVGGARLDVERAVTRRRSTLLWVRDLLQATTNRPAQLGCFGLHEWAMVYRQPAGQVRHPAQALRLGGVGTDAVVESLALRCSHADAFRFFTASARPRNHTQVGRERQLELEQPGCLHAGMDLYKWAYKLGPLTPSELVTDCFALARDIRALDMAASPYDLTAQGVDPVRVETALGRSEYVERQRGFTERATPVRAALLALTTQWLSV